MAPTERCGLMSCRASWSACQIRPSRSGSTRPRSSRPQAQFGDARRNSIEGPGSRLFDMAFTKIFPLSETRFLEFQGPVLEYIQHAAIRRN